MVGSVRPKWMRFAWLLACGLVGFLTGGPAWAFNPPRTFPDTTSTIRVFVDQLPSLSAAQAQFAASHYVGTQKQTSGQIDAIRAYNPNFIMIQYRLGMRDSGDQVQFIHNNTWSSDWSQITTHENWFLHDTTGDRVYMSYGSVKEWVMDPAGIVNGTGTSGWAQFWVNETKADISISHGDGVFADSSHLPYAIPNIFYTGTENWHGGTPPHLPLQNDISAWYQYVYQQYDAANLYFIPNISGLITTVDTNTCYYTSVHGAMVEGSAYNGNTSDWRLQANRTLSLVNNGKIYIAQNGPSTNTNITGTGGRLWHMANFLLLKGSHSYINITSDISQLHWFPEYDLYLGAPFVSGTTANIDALKVGSQDLYTRRYARGQVLVNASTTSTYTYSLTSGAPRLLVTPWGGGAVNSSGSPSAGGLYVTWLGTNVAVSPMRGCILADQIAAAGDANLDGHVDISDLSILAGSYGTAGKRWDQGDFSSDGVVDVSDLAILAGRYGTTDAGLLAVPEPATLGLLALGAGACLRRRRHWTFAKGSR